VTRRALALALAALLSSGCYRTVYVNVQAPGTPPPDESELTRARYQHGSWQSFFFYGFVPGSKDIDAVYTCGGEQHVESLETQQTFWQFLTSLAAGYYVLLNVYAPYRAQVNCDHPRTF